MSTNYSRAIMNRSIVNGEPDAGFAQQANAMAYDMYLRHYADATLGYSQGDYHDNYTRNISPDAALYGRQNSQDYANDYNCDLHEGENGSNMRSRDLDDMAQEEYASSNTGNNANVQFYRHELCDKQEPTKSRNQCRYEYRGKLNQALPSASTEVDVAEIMAPNTACTQSTEVQEYPEQDRELIIAAYPTIDESCTSFEKVERFLDMNATSYYQQNPTVFPENPRVFNRCVVPEDFEIPLLDKLPPGTILSDPPTFLPQNLYPQWPADAVPIEFVKSILGIDHQTESENLDLPPREPFFLAKEGITEITSQEPTACDYIEKPVPYRIIPQYLRGNTHEWKLPDLPPPQSEPVLPPQFLTLWKACDEEQRKEFHEVYGRDIPVYSKQWLKTVAHEPHWKQARKARKAQILTKVTTAVEPLFTSIPELLQDHEDAMSKGILGKHEIAAIDMVRGQLERLLKRFPKKELKDLVTVESSGVRESIEKGGMVVGFTMRIIRGEEWDAVYDDLYREKVEVAQERDGSVEADASMQQSTGESTQGSSDKASSTVASSHPSLSAKSSFDVEEFGSVSVSEKSTLSFRISQMAKPEMIVTAASPIEELERTLNDSLRIELNPLASPTVPTVPVPTTSSRQLFMSMMEGAQPEPIKLKMKDRVKAKVCKLKEKLSFRSKKV